MNLLIGKDTPDFAKDTVYRFVKMLHINWIRSPSSLHSVKEIGYDVIAMEKKTPKMFFWYNGEDMPLTTIYTVSFLQT